MGKTIAQKIIAAHLISGEMTVGSEIALKIDQVLKAIWCVIRLRGGKWIKKIKSEKEL